VDWSAVYLFAIVFYWTPPHFWALAMKYRDDYAEAGLPMLPVTHGLAESTRQILLYSYLLLSIVLLYIAGGGAGWLFTVPALVLTGTWLVLAHRLRRSGTIADAMRLFHFSTVYLALIFIVAAVDADLTGDRHVLADLKDRSAAGDADLDRLADDVALGGERDGGVEHDRLGRGGQSVAVGFQPVDQDADVGAGVAGGLGFFAVVERRGERAVEDVYVDELA
jgi:uncharacterized membrane protein YhdT